MNEITVATPQRFPETRLFVKKVGEDRAMRCSKLRVLVARELLVAQIWHEMTAGMREEPWTLMMEYAEETCHEKLIPRLARDG